MKITAGKREDILKRKAEYEADRAQRQARYDEQRQNYKQARNAVFQPIQQDLEYNLGKFSSLDFDVTVESHRYGGRGIHVRILCNEYKKFEDDVALAWSYDVELDHDGNVQAETSSWSGLKATTPAQMKSLKQTLDALDYLNTMDWKSLLDKTLPKSKDYISEEDPMYDRDRPDFDRELLEVEIEEGIGKSILFKGTTPPEGRYGFTRDVWYQILSETPKFYKVVPISQFYIDNNQYRNMLGNNMYVQNIKKDKLFSLLSKPVQTMEV